MTKARVKVSRAAAVPATEPNPQHRRLISADGIDLDLLCDAGVEAIAAELKKRVAAGEEGDDLDVSGWWFEHLGRQYDAQLDADTIIITDFDTCKLIVTRVPA